MTLGISDFIQKHQAAKLLHECIAPSVQDGWEKVECSLDSIDKNPDFRQYNQFHLRHSRLLLLGPILGIIVGVALHCVYGHQPELGWKGNFLLIFHLQVSGQASCCCLWGFGGGGWIGPKSRKRSREPSGDEQTAVRWTTTHLPNGPLTR